MTHNTCGKKNLRGGGCPSKAIIGIVISLLLSIVGSPVLANAATTTTTTTTVSEQYQLYNQKTRDQQVSINKVWNDGLTNDTRIVSSFVETKMLSETTVMLQNAGVRITTACDAYRLRQRRVLLRV